MRMRLLILGLILSINLSAQNVIKEHINWIDEMTRFDLSMSAHIERVKTGTKSVTVVNENREENVLPHLICIHDDGTEVILIHNKKKVLAVSITPKSVLGLEKVVVYLNHKNFVNFEYNDGVASGTTPEGKFVMYKTSDFSLTFMPSSPKKFLEEVDNYFK